MSVVDSLTERAFERPADRHLLLGGVVALGLAFRLYALGSESLWVDEIFSTRVVLDYGPAYILFRLPIQDPHPPLYYELLWLWTRVTGVSETSVRALSAVAGAATIPFVYAVAERLYDRRVGLVAGLLFAISPFYVWYGREARMYALLTLLAAASMYVMVAWLLDEEGSHASRWTYAAVTTGLVYTHAFGALLVLAQNVYVLFGLDPDAVDEDWYGEWVQMQGVVGVASIPWFYNLLGGMFAAGRFENNVAWIPALTPVDLWELVGSYVGRTQPPASPTVRRSLWQVGGVDLSPVGDLLALLALAALGYLFVRYLRDRYGGSAGTNSGSGDSAGDDAGGGDGDAEDAGSATGDGSDGGDGAGTGSGSGTSDFSESGRFRPGVVLSCWLLVPLGTLLLVSVLVTPLLVDRFTAPFGVAGVILVARAVTLVADTDRQTLAATGMILLVLAVPLSGMYAQPQKQQWEAAATVVEDSAERGDLVVVTPFWANDSYQYYAEREDVAYAGIPAGAARWEVAAATQDHDSVWLVVAHHNETQFDRLSRGMDRLGFERGRHVPLTELDVYHFVREGEG